MLLKLDEITTFYGKMRILEDVSIQVDEGELVCLLGGNASGNRRRSRPSLGSCVPGRGACSLTRLTSPRTRYLTGSHAGLAIVPENRRLFGEMTVLENLELGAVLQEDKYFRRTLIAFTSSSRGSMSAVSSWLARCPAASSRWWRWAAR